MASRGGIRRVGVGSRRDNGAVACVGDHLAASPTRCSTSPSTSATTTTTGWLASRRGR